MLRYRHGLGAGLIVLLALISFPITRSVTSPPSARIRAGRIVRGDLD